MFPTPGRILDKGECFNDEALFEFLIVAWTDNSEFYISKLPQRDSPSLSLDDIDKLEAQPIPKEHMYPLWRVDITEVQTPLPSDVYIKINHGLVNYEGTPHLVELLNAEIDILETLAKNPHPNICKYYGCIRAGDYVAGICLQRYKFTLADIVEGKVPVDQQPPFDADLVLLQIKAGLDWLHSLGLVHDDINPRNIMLADDGHAVIIDFDSCTSIGAKSRGGTPGWSKRPKTAEVANDEHGFDLVARFVRGDYDGQDFAAFEM
ncbi:hypothetical protein M413DRAFT_25886 [Hebeloma cylindrosporum]|uniref:Protein kinase domain-containing protein n=1 Tax=Hebeloma cylindrosporum TaxID=76867 RepID=A0A0C2Y105_HEBCY|nr:hypothetical protein M413DRAFT_25886 [Hebeloma cylindrosporum h7]